MFYIALMLVQHNTVWQSYFFVLGTKVFASIRDIDGKPKAREAAHAS